MTNHAECAVNRSRTQHYLTLVAAGLSMVGPFTLDTYLPSFQDIEASFGVDRVVLSQSLGGYLAAFAISTLAWGPLADRFGRRRVILSSLTLYVLASIGCAIATDIHTFLLARVVQGLGASGGFIAGRATIRDAHDAKAAHRAMSQVTLVFALAPAIAPILGGWLHDHLGWRSVFWFLAGLGLLLIGLVLLLEETLNKKHRRSLHPAAVLGAYLRTLIHSHFLRLILSLSFAFAGLFLYIAGAPTVIYDFLGLGAGDFGLQFVPMVGGMIAGAWLTGRLAHRWPIRRTVTFGLFLASTAALLNLSLASLVETTAVSVIAPLTLYSLGFAIAMPAITIQALDYFPQHRGTATSIQGFLQMLISAGVASLAVPLLQGHWWQFALGQFAFVLLALGFWLREAKNFTSITQDLL